MTSRVGQFQFTLKSDLVMRMTISAKSALDELLVYFKIELHYYLIGLAFTNNVQYFNFIIL